MISSGHIHTQYHPQQHSHYICGIEGEQMNQSELHKIPSYHVPFHTADIADFTSSPPHNNNYHDSMHEPCIKNIAVKPQIRYQLMSDD